MLAVTARFLFIALLAVSSAAFGQTQPNALSELNAAARAAYADGRGAGRRVIHAESVFDRAGAMALLGTIVADRGVGEAFFGDDTRMERDLLADAAAEHLMRLFGRLGAD